MKAPAMPPPIHTDAVYTTEQAAHLLSFHPETIRERIRCGQIKAKGRPYRIRGSELLKLA